MLKQKAGFAAIMHSLGKEWEYFIRIPDPQKVWNFGKVLEDVWKFWKLFLFKFQLKTMDLYSGRHSRNFETHNF